MYKAGTITLVAPSIGMALAVNGAEKWFVPRNRRGQFSETSDHPQLGQIQKSVPQQLPIVTEVIYFLVNEDDPFAVKLWATRREYLDVAAIIQKKKELAARPKVRVMEQLIERGVAIGEPTILMPEMLRADFLKKHPITGRFDPFTPSGDFLKTRKRWFEETTLEGWTETPDPRKKP